MNAFVLFSQLMNERKQKIESRFLLKKGNRTYVCLGFLSSVVCADDPLEPLNIIRAHSNSRPLIYVGTAKKHAAFRMAADEQHPSAFEARRHLAWKTWVSVKAAIHVLYERTTAYAIFKRALLTKGIVELPAYSENLGLSLLHEAGVGHVMRPVTGGLVIFDANRYVIPTNETYFQYVDQNCDEEVFDLRDGTWFKIMYAHRRRPARIAA